MRVLGVDPGLTGYLCWVTLEDGAVKEMSHAAMPYDGKQMCPKRLKTIIEGQTCDLIAIERAQGWTGDGGSRAFNYGMNFGIIYTIARQWEYANDRQNSLVFLYPQTWHSIMRVRQERNKTKEHALARALEIIPDHQVFEDRGKLRDGLVDAFLIALAGYESYIKGIQQAH